VSFMGLTRCYKTIVFLHLYFLIVSHCNCDSYLAPPYLSAHEMWSA